MRRSREGVGGMTEQLVAFLVIMLALAAVLPALLAVEIARREARAFSLAQEEARNLARLLVHSGELDADAEEGLELARLDDESLRRAVETLNPSHPGAVRVLNLAQNGTVVASAAWGVPYSEGPVAGGSFPVLLGGPGTAAFAGLLTVALWGF